MSPLNAMRPITLLAAAGLVLSACATAAPPAPGGAISSAQDCAVIAAIAKEHYRFGPDNVPPPLWVESEDETGAPWRLSCDWAAHGLAFPETYDPEGPPQDRVRWVQFKRPRYDGRGALVETGILHGPLAGMGHECRVVSGVAGWTLAECRATWIS